MSERDDSIGECVESPAPIGVGGPHVPIIEDPEATPERAPRAPVATAPQEVVPLVEEPGGEPGGEPGEDPGGGQATIVPEQLREHARRYFGRVREHAEAPSPPPAADRVIDNILWGLAQPALGLRVLLREHELIGRAVVPVALFVIICGFVALAGEAEGLGGWIKSYYATLVAAAPLSPVIFTRSYAKLAAASRPYLGLDHHPPYLRSYWQAFVESIVQLIVLGVGVAPLVAIVTKLPLFGWIWGAVFGWAWLLHWIVVEALDSARTLAPGEEPKEVEQRWVTLHPPWYSGAVLAKLRFPLGTLLLPIRIWGAILAKLGRRWRGEVALVETRPWIAAGFGLGAAVLLAIPLVNLLFRPAVIVAASHVLGQLEPELPRPPRGADDNEPEA
ncbi:hypothetical protein ENSA5_41310 [Enhygromyxa salina]|uniref:Uncharacterized protein n=1 Tax=Enhygromyxa salina TaxID=215803 RepID=A0A2S9XMR4_9BACT|nr:hypothetical protein [Enhygromyxa salina]PRP94176.1 hypothetical protein ENSA5_41310 [Enhygromyxa salina]